MGDMGVVRFKQKTTLCRSHLMYVLYLTVMSRLHSQHLGNSHCLNVIPWVKSIVVGHILFLTLHIWIGALSTDICSLWQRRNMSCRYVLEIGSPRENNTWTRVTCGLSHHDMSVMEIVHLWTSEILTSLCQAWQYVYNIAKRFERWRIMILLGFYSHNTWKRLSVGIHTDCKGH